jgi:DNA-binding response OmpR family regulator
MATILIVEDDDAIRAALKGALASHGHVTRAYGTAFEALQEAATSEFELVILDLGLPDLDGEATLRMLRGISDVPVIVATARSDDATIVRLLGAGADDYVVKPFSAEQIAARIVAVLRRVSSTSDENIVVVVGSIRIDLRERLAWLENRELRLSRLEFDLLAHLAQRAGEVVTRRELITNIWQQPYMGDDQTIDVHLSWLRKKLGESAANPKYLHTIRGVGVKLVWPG